MRRHKYWYLLVVLLAAANWLVWSDLAVSVRPASIRLTIFDVGQGQSILIQDSLGNDVLIDGGPDGSAAEKLAQSLPFFNRNLELVVLTHPDADHLTGLLAVLEKFPVGAVLLTGVVGPNQRYQDLVEILLENNTPVYQAIAGTSVILADQAEVLILNPQESFWARRVSRTNQTSIAALLRFGDVRALLTGDIDLSTEKRLISSGTELKADVMTVPHHGSRNSTSEELLENVRPELAVISVGRDNPYGHPAQAVLQRLKAEGVAVYRTDLDGDLKLETDGAGWLFFPERR